MFERRVRYSSSHSNICCLIFSRHSHRLLCVLSRRFSAVNFSTQSTNMSVEIYPEQLEFNRTYPAITSFASGKTLTWLSTGPFTQHVIRYLKVRNSNETPVVYRVKTTAPRTYPCCQFCLTSSYCARPNRGRIDSHKEVEIQSMGKLNLWNNGWQNVVIFQPQINIPLNMKCQDKFLIQSTWIIDESADINLSDLVLLSLYSLVDSAVDASWEGYHGG